MLNVTFVSESPEQVNFDKLDCFSEYLLIEEVIDSRGVIEDINDFNEGFPLLVFKLLGLFLGIAAEVRYYITKLHFL